MLYANLGVRGLRTDQVRQRQLEPALAMRPDLATVFTGTNDVIARRFDAIAVAGEMERMQRALVDSGATVITFTLPDLAPVMPMARLITPRIRAMNDALRAAVARSGAILVDFAESPLAADARLWSADRIHASPLGHERIAEALAHAIGLEGATQRWTEPLSVLPFPGAAARWGRELGWIFGHLAPWAVSSVFPKRARGAGPKRPRLERISPPASS